MYDAVLLDEPAAPFDERHARLAQRFAAAAPVPAPTGSQLLLTENVELAGPEGVLELHERFTAEGFEGLMVLPGTAMPPGVASCCGGGVMSAARHRSATNTDLTSSTGGRSTCRSSRPSQTRSSRSWCPR